MICHDFWYLYSSVLIRKMKSIYIYILKENPFDVLKKFLNENFSFYYLINKSLTSFTIIINKTKEKNNIFIF